VISWRETRPFDYILLIVSLALTGYGLLLIYSGNLSDGQDENLLTGPVGRQIAFAIIGLFFCLLVAKTNYRFLGQVSIVLYFGLIASLLFVMVAGSAAHGSTRWIEIGGGIAIQPSEMGKLVVILVLAKYLSDNRERVNDIRVFASSMAIAALPALIVFAQPDLGSSIIFMLIWLGMVIMAGADMRHVLGSVGAVIAMTPFAIIAIITDYQRERISLFLDPRSDSLGSGFNILQAEISVGSGGLFGKGLTQGSQTQLDYLRTQTTDYVFSVLGEELGFVGAMILFSLFILLLLRGLRAASISRDVFGQLVAVGVVIFICFQAFINIGVNIRLFPVTGIPLPFVSQGGSSLITVYLAIGLLESVITRHRQISADL
jgi:rod shape determining protein RodA